jgi:hypothetical protein
MPAACTVGNETLAVIEDVSPPEAGAGGGRNGAVVPEPHDATATAAASKMPKPTGRKSVWKRNTSTYLKSAAVSHPNGY